MTLNKYIDHTLLKPDATKEQIDKLIDEALQYDFASICVNPVWVSYVSDKLKGSNVKICSVIGFPFGANKTATKVYETQQAIIDGANEIDMVINISKAKEHDYNYILNEINEIKKASNSNILKVIVETGMLDNEEKKQITRIVLESNADYIKTSTGVNSTGATVEDITLFKDILQDKKKIKASGGIRDTNSAQSLIDAGAERLGTSGGVAIVNNKENKENY